MKTSDILYGAADHIAAFGHLKNRLHGPGSPETAPACLIGALEVACGTIYEPLSVDGVRAYGALSRYLHWGMLSAWNNAPERTAEEVIEALRACAVIEAAKEPDTALAGLVVAADALTA